MSTEISSPNTTLSLISMIFSISGFSNRLRQSAILLDLENREISYLKTNQNMCHILHTSHPLPMAAHKKLVQWLTYVVFLVELFVLLLNLTYYHVQ